MTLFDKTRPFRGPKMLFAAGALLLAFGLGYGASPALAARPSAGKLLPKDTVVYVRAADIRGAVKQFSDTGLGRMAQDPQMQPLVKALYGSAAGAWTEWKSRADLSLDELLAIPQGEVALAISLPSEGPPVFLALIDAAGQMPAVQKVFERITSALEKTGATRTEETSGDVKLTVFGLRGRGGPRQAVYAFKDDTVVFGTDVGMVKELLSRWDGRITAAVDTLVENPTYKAVLNATRSREGDPDVVFFVDPIELARGLAQGNPGAQLALAVLPTLGLDGLKGLGGSVAMGVGDFDLVVQAHLLLDNPRSGVLELVQFAAIDPQPPKWVPADAASYTALAWNVEKTYTVLADLVDSFQGKGSFARQVKERASDNIGADLETEILPLLTGRVVLYSHVQRPAVVNGEAALAGFQLKDPAVAEKVMQKIVEKWSEKLEKRTYGTATYYTVKAAERAVDASQPGSDSPAVAATPRPAFAIVGDEFFASDRPKILENTLIQMASGEKSLGDTLDYKLIASKIGRQAAGAKPGLISFSRTDEKMRMLFELAANQEQRDAIRKASRRNAAMNILLDSVEKNPLPPFEVVQKYFAPGGSMITSDETGVHYTTFVLKRK